MSVKDNIAKNICYLRKENKMTQLQLAQQLNYSPKAISKWERAESVPEIETLKQIADIFGVRVDYLLDENPLDNIDDYVLPKITHKNHIIMGALLVSIIATISTIVFVYLNIYGHINKPWMVFLWAVPISCFGVFAYRRHSSNRKFKFITLTIFLWSLLISINVQTFEFKTYLIYVAGIPCQLSLLLWLKIIKIK